MEAHSVLRDLALMFAAAKLAGALFERLRQPAVIGELLVGILMGPHLLGWISDAAALEVFQELGAIILLFVVGLDTPLSELKEVGGRSIAVGGVGILIPFAAGVGLLLLWGNDGDDALFMGTAMVATSIGVTARVLADLGRIKEPESRIILGAAVVDDILGLLVLAVVAGSITGSLSAGSIISLALLALAFVILVGGLGARLIDRATPLLDRLGDQGVLVFALALCLGLASTAAALDLAAIIGAFLAGMALAETRDRYHLEEHLHSVYSFLVPFFFVVTGTFVDPGVFAEGGTALLTVAVVLVAIGGKLFGCGAAAWGMGRSSAAIVGVGMVPRGEVGILVATVGLREGIIGPDLYGIAVAMSVLTTIVVPPVLARLFRDRPPGPASPHSPRTHEVEGIGG